ncbi:hypothetical protein L6Q96_11665 [Candidatus Binatia bacterium]|nr:hypothetical protein [Candidatus Binatia bacterium]
MEHRSSKSPRPALVMSPAGSRRRLTVGRAPLPARAVRALAAPRARGAIVPSPLSLLFLTLLAVIPAHASSGQTPTVAPVYVRATIDRAEAAIGDLLRYTLTVDFAAGTQVSIPALSGRLGDFEIVDFGDVPPPTGGPRGTSSHWYVLRSFDVGSHTIAAPPVRYRGQGDQWHDVTANEVQVTVRSLLGEDGGADIRDIKGPEAVPFDWRPMALVGGTGVVVLAIGAALFLLLGRPRRARAVPPLPPDVVALAALTRLQAECLPDAGRFEVFYVELSSIVRRYLEDRFAVHAPEMTTEEFLAAAARDSRLGAPQKRLLGEFLAEADLVKFARHVPTLAASGAAFEAARRFVNDTRPAILPESRRAAA